MINKLTITGGYKNGRSYLKDTFFTRPFRVADISEHRDDPALYLMVMSSSPGILDGDHYDIHIDVETGCRLQLQSQSYQRLFQMRNGAKQLQHITLHPGSELSYVQHPVVPHENAIFKGHNKIVLDDNCRFTFGEIITCGRKLSGEIFRYTTFHAITEVYHKKKLIVKDNVLLQPQRIPVDVTGQLEGYTHQATLLYVSTAADDLSEMPDRWHELLAGETGVETGISRAGPQVVALRMLGNGGEQLYACLQKVQQYLWTGHHQQKK